MRGRPKLNTFLPPFSAPRVRRGQRIWLDRSAGRVPSGRARRSGSPRAACPGSDAGPQRRTPRSAHLPMQGGPLHRRHFHVQPSPTSAGAGSSPTAASGRSGSTARSICAQCPSFAFYHELIEAGLPVLGLREAPEWLRRLGVKRSRDRCGVPVPSHDKLQPPCRPAKSGIAGASRLAQAWPE